MSEPIPHWPGRLVRVGGHQVYVRSAPAGPDAGRALFVHGLEGYGSRDRLVDARMAGRAARQFRDARIVVMPRTGHVAHMEHPEAVAAEIGVLLGIPGLFRRLTQARAGEENSQPVR